MKQKRKLPWWKLTSKTPFQYNSSIYTSQLKAVFLFAWGKFELFSRLTKNEGVTVGSKFACLDQDKKCSAKGNCLTFWDTALFCIEGCYRLLNISQTSFSSVIVRLSVNSTITENLRMGLKNWSCWKRCGSKVEVMFHFCVFQWGNLFQDSRTLFAKRCFWKQITVGTTHQSRFMKSQLFKAMRRFSRPKFWFQIFIPQPFEHHISWQNVESTQNGGRKIFPFTNWSGFIFFLFNFGFLTVLIFVTVIYKNSSLFLQIIISQSCL